MTGTYEDPRKVFGAEICRLALKDERIVLLSADSGKSSGFGEMIEKAPERYFEFGIMEQMAIGAASGLASTGKIPVFCAIAPFVTARPYEMFRNDLGYMRQNAKIVGRNGGMSYSDLGSTHHSLDDFGIMSMIPGVVLLNPQDPDEIRGACEAMLKHEGPVYMRIGNGKIPGLFPAEEFRIGKGRLIRVGTDVTIISTGVQTAAAIEAVSELKQRGIYAELIGLPTLKPLDEELILASAKKTGRVMTLEEHYICGGLGSMVADLLCEKLPVPLKKLAVPHCYAISGPYEGLLRHYGLDSHSVALSAEAFVRG